MGVSSHTPNGSINAVPEIIKLINSINSSRGNINIVLEIYTCALSGYLNTAEIEQHMHSGHINTVSINSTYMLSDNLNTCAINKYTNTLRGDDNRTAATW